MNAYDMLVDLRDNVGEDTASHWGDNNLLRKLNHAYRLVGTSVMTAPGDWLVKSASVTPVSSVITLPSDCAKPVYLEHTSNGYPIDFAGTTVRERSLTRPVGVSLEIAGLDAYLQGNTIILNQESYSDACTLWYVRRPSLLHTGTADAGGAASLTLDAANVHSVVNDYYNGVGIEILAGTGIGDDTIIDYSCNTSGVGTCGVTGTYSTDSKYGTVSELPEEADAVVLLQATLAAMAKPSSSVDPKYFEYFLSLFKEAKKDLNTWIASRVSESMYTRVTEID